VPKSKSRSDPARNLTINASEPCCRIHVTCFDRIQYTMMSMMPSPRNGIRCDADAKARRRERRIASRTRQGKVLILVQGKGQEDQTLTRAKRIPRSRRWSRMASSSSTSSPRANSEADPNSVTAPVSGLVRVGVCRLNLWSKGKSQRRWRRRGSKDGNDDGIAAGAVSIAGARERAPPCPGLLCPSRRRRSCANRLTATSRLPRSSTSSGQPGKASMPSPRDLITLNILRCLLW
jgi:hypothetical protein